MGVITMFPVCLVYKRRRTMPESNSGPSRERPRPVAMVRRSTSHGRFPWKATPLSFGAYTTAGPICGYGKDHFISRDAIRQSGILDEDRIFQPIPHPSLMAYAPPMPTTVSRFYTVSTFQIWPFGKLNMWFLSQAASAGIEYAKSLLDQ